MSGNLLSKYVVFSDIYSAGYKKEKRKVRRYEFRGLIPEEYKISELITDLNDVMKKKVFDNYPLDNPGVLFLLGTEDNCFESCYPGIECADNTDISFLLNLGEHLDSCGLKYAYIVIWTKIRKKPVPISPSWRRIVLNNDKSCICCGGDKKLEVHHIFQKSEYPELVDDPDNGAVLCHWCHKKYHSYFPEEVNPKTLLEFLKMFGGGISYEK